MSIYWFLIWLGHEIKTSVYKMFIWKLPDPETHKKEKPSYLYHINPYLVGWLGFFVLLKYAISRELLDLAAGSLLITFAFFYRLYWKGMWIPYMKGELNKKSEELK